MQSDLTKEDKRKLWQYLMVRLQQQENAPNLMMTPDVVCIFMSYLIQRFTEKNPITSIMDPAIGTGNLLTAVLNGFSKLPEEGIYGIDISKQSLKYCVVNAELQGTSIELICGDYLVTAMPAVHTVVCDLPIGYYPNEEVCGFFQLSRTETMSYSHELYIEKILSHIMPGGYMFLLIPNHLFEKDHTKALHRFILKHAYIYGLLQLPNDLFQKEIDQKSIFVLRKKGDGVNPLKQMMMVQIPSFQKEEGFQNILVQMNQWFKEQLK